MKKQRGRILIANFYARNRLGLFGCFIGASLTKTHLEKRAAASLGMESVAIFAPSRTRGERTCYHPTLFDPV